MKEFAPLANNRARMMSSQHRVLSALLLIGVGGERARKVIEWKQGDHYKAIYTIDLNSREKVEGIMKRHGVSW